VTRLPGLDSSTGSLGQGLSVGVGMALGARMSQKDFHTWVMLGDGEIQEGMIWEAVQVAARYKLSNLTAIVDRNGLQQFGLPSSVETTLTDRGDRRDPWFGVDLAAVFQAFGWRVVEINGHDYGQIRNAYQLARAGDYEGRPTVIIAHTVKGKGLSLAEGVYTWHSIVPTADDFEKARRELEPDELEILDNYPTSKDGAQA
jgi:transketolase